jgi:MYND finger
MASETNSSPLVEEEYAPFNGSWVAELEDAQAALATLLRTPVKGGGAAAARKRRSELLHLHLRLCRAYRTLRQWDLSQEEAKKGLKVCATYKGKGGAAAAARIAEWKALFASHRAQAQHELSVPSYLNQDWGEDHLREGIAATTASLGVAGPAMIGDVRLMEVLVARGAAIDKPVPLNLFDWTPRDATPLLVVCLDVVGHDAEHTEYPGNPTEEFLRMLGNAVDRKTECAMQLVRLGAVLTRTLNLRTSLNLEEASVFRAAGFDGKTLLELAKMTKRTELVELIEQHLRYTPEERAEVVHCRCGSRLPWKACHGGKGVGHAPHYQVSDEVGVAYRLSPLVKCPCGNTGLTYYECCWKDTSSPVYLADVTGRRFRMVPARRGLEGNFDAFFGLTTLPARETPKSMAAKYAALLRSDSDALKKAYAREGPKCRVASWDPKVYAGCLERLADDDDDFFLWTDLHWKVDTSELVRRARAWNTALKKCCLCMGLEGEEKAHVLAMHKADPCAPCGRVGCDAFKKQPKEFQRCSRCKLIAYCSPECQKLDWTEHRKMCHELVTK